MVGARSPKKGVKDSASGFYVECTYQSGSQKAATEGFNAADIGRVVANVKALYAADVVCDVKPATFDRYFDRAAAEIRRTKELIVSGLNRHARNIRAARQFLRNEAAETCRPDPRQNAWMARCLACLGNDGIIGCEPKPQLSQDLHEADRDMRKRATLGGTRIAEIIRATSSSTAAVNPTSGWRMRRRKLTHVGLLSCCLRPTLIVLNGRSGQRFRQLVNLFAVNPAGGWPQVAQSSSDASAICGAPDFNSDLAGEQRDLIIGTINKRAQPRPMSRWHADFGKNSERASTLTQMGNTFPFSVFTGL
jgi:hypothetical protein